MVYTPSPNDFLGDRPPDRIIGTERECNIQTPPNRNLAEYISPEAIRKAGHLSVCGFLDNGSKIYTDVGHLEVATAESLGPSQAAAADFAGILLLKSVVEASSVPHNGLHSYSGVVIRRSGTTSGYHENFLIPRIIETSKLFDTVMASHLTSRIWASAGAVTNKFELSQKVRDIGDPPIIRDLSRRTTKKQKPMAAIPPFEVDKDTIGRYGAWARLEVRFADAGYSPTTRYLSLAATSLTLRLIEHRRLIDGEKLKAFSFRQHALTAQKFSKDLSFTQTAETLSYAQISAVDYQEILNQAYYDLSEEIELPTDEKNAIDLLQKMCDQLRASDIKNEEYAGLLTDTDFAPRHRYLTRSFNKNTLNCNNPAAVEASLTWDRISPTGGALKYWTHFTSPYIKPLEIQNLLNHAPPTRAATRGSLIADSKFNAIFANWSTIDNPLKSIKLNSPFQT